jgi:hypothetical protein
MTRDRAEELVVVGLRKVERRERRPLLRLQDSRLLPRAEVASGGCGRDRPHAELEVVVRDAEVRHLEGDRARGRFDTVGGELEASLVCPSTRAP